MTRRIRRGPCSAQKIWRRAEELGFHAAYTYDHLSWRSFRDEPWFGSVPTLTAAAGVTERLRLGSSSPRSSLVHPSRADLRRRDKGIDAGAQAGSSVRGPHSLRESSVSLVTTVTSLPS
nr:LLM class flavin-dependent oxidoreductase [Streptomyces sp. CBMA123]